MPNNLTLLDLAKLNGADPIVGLIEEVGTVAPEVTTIPARTIRGTSYETVARSVLPTVDFRKVNEGTAATKSEFVSRRVETFVLSARVEADKAAARAYEDGPEAYQALEARGVMEAALIKLGAQTIYGTAAGTEGFNGLEALTTALGAVVTDAGGTTAGTGSSVYIISAGSQGVQYVYGNNSPLELSPFREGDGVDAAGNRFAAFVADLTARVGLQLVNKNAVARLKDFTDDAGKGVTDGKILDALRRMPLAARPTHILMSPRSAYQLAIARTITPNQKVEAGSGLVKGFPVESNGLPIIVTNSILETETLS
jgi:hypothetical protein